MRHLRTLRGRLTAVAFLVALVAIVLMTAAFDVVLTSALDSDANSRLRAQAAAVATTVRVRAGRVSVVEGPGDAALDRQAWVYEGTRALERAPGDAEVQRSADALAGRAHVHHDLPDREFRLYAAPVLSGGRQVGTVVTGLSLAAYDRTVDLAQIGSIAFGAVLLAAVLFLTWIVVGRALSPVREMTRSAADWGEQDGGRRFGSTPRPDELGDLARTFDALLDRVAASLRHEQRLSAELSHELRTPLTRIVAETELLQRRDRPLAERDEAYGSIARSAGQMHDILATLMAAARADARLDAGRSDLRPALDAVRASWPPSAPALTVEAPDGPLAVGVDSEVVDRILGPLLDNARRYADAAVGIEVARGDGCLEVAVTDDGPGLAEPDRETAFEPGVRIGGPDAHAGAGLGLPLARRLARAAGGDVAFVTPGGARGARVRVRLPA
jgi:signal transduction histidine kinase